LGELEGVGEQVQQHLLESFLVRLDEVVLGFCLLLEKESTSIFVLRIPDVESFDLNILHAGLVFLESDDFLNSLPDVEHCRVFCEIFFFFVQNGVVEDVVNEEVDELDCRVHLLVAHLHSLVDLVHAFRQVSQLGNLGLYLFELCYHIIQIFKKSGHRLDLADKRIERIPQFVGDGCIDESSERLLCFDFTVKDFVRDVDNLEQALKVLILVSALLSAAPPADLELHIPIVLAPLANLGVLTYTPPRSLLLDHLKYLVTEKELALPEQLADREGLSDVGIE